MDLNKLDFFLTLSSAEDLSEYSFLSNYDDEFDHGIVVLSYEGIRVGVNLDLAKQFSKFTKSLDLTENELSDLGFLKTFNKLETLVLDKNRLMNPLTMPTMKSLEVLWLNSCNISDVGKWIEVIRNRCPKLRCLSMINNPGARSLVNLSTPEENEKYRSLVASRIPRLMYLDEAPITEKERTAGGVGKEQFLSISRLFKFGGKKGTLEDGDCCRTRHITRGQVVLGQSKGKGEVF